MRDPSGGTAAARQQCDSEASRIATLETEVARLRRSEAHCRTMVESAGDFAIFTTGLDGVITSWNPGAERLLGWSEPEAVGQHACMIFTPADQARAACDAEMRGAREDGRAEDERWHVRKDGTRFWASGLMMRLQDDVTGTHVGYLKILRDRTPQHEANKRVRESEARLRLLLNSSGEGFYAVDREGATTLCNAAFLRMFGFVREEDALGRKLHDIIHHSHPDGRGYPAHECPIYRTAQTGDSAHVEDEVFFRLDGTSFPVEYWVHPIFRDGTLQGAVCTFIDITGRKQAERALQESQARLRLEREMLNAVIRQAPVGISIAEAPSGRAIVINDKAVELIGHAPGGEGVERYKSFGAVHPDGRPYAVGDYPTVRAARDGQVIEREAMLYCRGGPDQAEVRQLEVSSTPVRDETGAVVAAVTVFADATDQRRAEAVLRERVEQQAILMGEVSHRVKNSLALVAGLLGLQARAATDPAVRAAFEDARARVGTIAQVHDQLWRQTQVETVDLSQFLKDLCVKLKETAPNHTLVVEANPSIVVPTDQAIPLGLLANELVTNAFKYAYPDGAGEVRIVLHASAERVRLEVADRGVGLPDGFDLAQSAKGSLGTRLINGFVRQLGGTLEVSDAGPGARFVLDIPRAGGKQG